MNKDISLVALLTIIMSVSDITHTIKLGKPKVKTHRDISFRNMTIEKSLNNNPTWTDRNSGTNRESFHNDDQNFTHPETGERARYGEIQTHVKVTTEPIVLVNIHAPDELYLGPDISGPFVPGKHRSLSWATDLKSAVFQAKTQDQYHEGTALLEAWSKNKLREEISFIIIPAGSKIEYKVGKAASQSQGDQFRAGGGQQIRLKEVPIGTIVLTQRAIQDQQLSRSEGLKKIDIIKSFKTAIEKYNAEHPNTTLSQDLITRAYYSFQDSLADPSSAEARTAIVERLYTEREELNVESNQNDTKDKELSRIELKRQRQDELRMRREKASKAKREATERMRNKAEARDRIREAF